MTPSELKSHVEQSETESYFFTRDSMRFFGDTMKNYGVRAAEVETYGSKIVQCWELYRKRPVKHGNQQSAYFDKETFQRVFPAQDAPAKE